MYDLVLECCGFCRESRLEFIFMYVLLWIWDGDKFEDTISPLQSLMSSSGPHLLQGPKKNVNRILVTITQKMTI